MSSLLAFAGAAVGMAVAAALVLGAYKAARNMLIDLASFAARLLIRQALPELLKHSAASDARAVIAARRGEDGTHPWRPG